ncbi:hypothetical protein [Halobellus ordinarius]|uniref:hypothetical protein n=1 Tax=Halobellus ordinarius TaxID=3075120 RepID=UPI0028807418|nr:hypothetical protein [Halobellus sp. ZY16]
MGMLAVVCFGLVLSAVYPFTTTEPHAANAPSERFTVGETDAFSATGSLVVDGQVRLAFDGVVTADGAWYQRVVDGGVVSAAYQPDATGPVYRKRTIAGSDNAEQQRELIAEDEDRVLVDEDRDGDNVTLVVKENGTGVTQPVSGTASVFVNSLVVAGYEADGSDSSDETVYTPRAGWYDRREPYRITDASGAVRTDANSHVVTAANVSWDTTEPAGTYMEYLLVRSFSDEPTTYRITFEFESGDAELERPSWVRSDLSHSQGVIEDLSREYFTTSQPKQP